MLPEAFIRLLPAGPQGLQLTPDSLAQQQQQQSVAVDSRNGSSSCVLRAVFSKEAAASK
jgi:hypothetical protein